jgi:hypothetical protein
MKKLFSIVLTAVLLSSTAQAQTVIGFRGAGGAFDERAFMDYAAKRNATGMILYSDQINLAMQVIKQNVEYELYGYSLGAASVGRVLRLVESNKLHKPRYVLTAGAWHSTNVDFQKYNIKFDNYFDASGAGQKSPGKHIGGVSHRAIMRYVTDQIGD